jgi:hypothetical protein
MRSLFTLRDGLEISAKCHVQRENLGQFHSKTGLAYVLVRMIVEPLILSHAGGFLPYAAARFAQLLHAVNPRRTVEALTSDMQAFYFGAAFSTPTGLPSLLASTVPLDVAKAWAVLWAVLLIALENVLKAYRHPWHLNRRNGSTDMAGTAS